MPIHIPVEKRADHDTSDGYHTFDELYEFRMLYNAAFFMCLADIDDMKNKNPSLSFDVHKSKRHSDGELCFGGGWFVVVAYLGKHKFQITNHYPMKDWDLFDIPERERADKWDGHSPEDVAKRIRGWLKPGSVSL